MQIPTSYCNGLWIPNDKLVIPAQDLTVLRGFGIFDFLRTYHKKPFRLVEHIDRLFHSAKIMGIRIPYSKLEVRKLILEGIQKNNLSDHNIRIIVTGGVSNDGISMADNSSLLVIFSKAHGYPKSFYSQGVKIITKHYERSIPEVKSLNYMIAVQALFEAKKHNAVEVLYVDHADKIRECTTSNFFGVIGNMVITPKDHILAGITKNVVLEIARRLNMSVIETDMLVSQISLLDEAFITASNKEIMPVTFIDSNKIGSGTVGPITKRLMKNYRKETKSL